MVPRIAYSLVIIPKIPIIPLLVEFNSQPSRFNKAVNAFNFAGVIFFSKFSSLWTAIASGRSVPDSGRRIFNSILSGQALYETS